MYKTNVEVRAVATGGGYIGIYPPISLP